MRSSFYLSIIIFSLTILSCSKDSVDSIDPFTQSLINTKWEIDKIEIYTVDTNEIMETIEPEISTSKKIFFRSNNKIQLLTGDIGGALWADGCGSWAILSGNLIASINFDQIISGNCSVSNFVSHYRNNNKIYKNDEALIIEGVSGSFDSINSSHQYWAELIDGKLKMLSYYKASVQVFPEPICC